MRSSDLSPDVADVAFFRPRAERFGVWTGYCPHLVTVCSRTNMEAHMGVSEN